MAKQKQKGKTKDTSVARLNTRVRKLKKVLRSSGIRAAEKYAAQYGLGGHLASLTR